MKGVFPVSGNLHKSDSGWVRLQARVNAREGVRASRMDHRPEGRKLEEEALKKPPKRRRAVDQVAVDDDGQPFIVKNGRKRRRAFVSHNGR